MTTTPARDVVRSGASVAGALAAAVALSASEFAAAVLSGARSPVVAVGDTIIDLAPGPVERAAISAVGTADKPLLLAAIVVVSLVIGSALGRIAVRRFAVAAAGMAAFSGVGIVAALRDTRSDVAPTIAVAVLGTAAGVAVLGWLTRAGAAVGAPAETMDGAHSRTAGHDLDRRSFLRAAATAAAVAAVGAVSARLIAGRDTVNAIRAAIRLPAPFRPAPAVPAGAELVVAGITPLFVPNADFYRIDTALSVPQVDPASWSLRIRGKVDRPLRFTYDELLAMPHIEADVTLSCVSNEVGGGLVGNARWQGVALRELLDRAGVQPDAAQIVGRSVDGFTAAFPTQIALQQDNAMVAVAMNGEALPARHGFPARLVIPGLYGYVSATKWLSSIELVDESFEGYWIPRGWSKLGPVKTQSRIDVPRSSSNISPGRTPIAGVAWAPTRGIDRVEIRIDEGDWQPARLADSLGVEAWRQWVYEGWDAAPGPHEIAVRATDGTGVAQTDERTDVAPNGADGHHTIRVEVGD